MLFGRFSNNSKAYHGNIAASQTLERPVVSVAPEATVHERLVLVLNARTSLRDVEQALSSSQSKMPLRVIYTSRPTLLEEGKSEGEVDYEFAYRLNYGKNFLDKVSSSAKLLGFASVETNFIWNNTAADLIEKVKETGDQVFDLTRN